MRLFLPTVGPQFRRISARGYSAFALAVLLAPQALAWPDLRIGKSGPAQAAPGDVITYTLSYSNSGPVKSTQVAMKDFVPANVTVLTGTLNGGTLSGSTITWSLGTLNSQAKGSRTFQVRINPNAPSGSFITNRVQIFGKEAEEKGKTNDNSAKWITAIVGLNRAPVANDDAYSTPEDTTLTVSAPGILANDSDADGDVLTALLVSNPLNGTLTLNTNGSFSYTPNADFHGTDTFTYRARDGTTNSAVATVCITVTPVNDPPVARADHYATLEDTGLNVTAPGVLANDSDADGDVLTANVTAPPTNGVVVLNPNGSFSYTPNSNYHGLDSFTYRANDGTINSGKATVTITVMPVNDPPVAQNDAYSGAENTLLIIAAPGVLANDSDADGEALTTILVSNPTNGILVLNADGSFSYAPNPNFHGLDSFSYRANDGTISSGIATVAIAVTPVNDPPVAVADEYSTGEDVVLMLPPPGVLTNDFDSDGDVLTAILASNPAQGAVTLNTNGGFTYIPNTNFNGVDIFAYRASDGVATSEVVTVTITVLGANDPPVARDDDYSVAEDTLLDIAAPGVLTNDSDPDGDLLTAVLASGPVHGTLSLDPAGGFSYRPNTNFNGIDSFTYRANDGSIDSALATVRITVVAVNDPPLVQNDQYTTAEDTVLVVAAPGVLLNDSDPDGDVLSVVLATAPTNGLLILNGDGGFIYTPNTNFFGLDSFTYRANDGQLDSALATVNLQVTPVYDPPDTNNWTGRSFTGYEDRVLDVAAPGVLRGIVDLKGNLLEAGLVRPTTNGTLNLELDGSFRFVPLTNFNGRDRFQFAITTDQTNSLALTVDITVLPVNDPPSFSKGGNFRLPQNAGSQVATNWATAISPGPINESSQTATFLVSNDNNALFAIPPAVTPEGTLSFTPADNASGLATITVTARDDGGTADGGVDTSAPQTFTISLNTPPTVQITSPADGVSFFVPGSFTLLADAQDVDGSVVKVEFFSNTNKIAEVTNGAPFFTVLTNLPVGNYTLGVTATDDLGAIGVAMPVTVSVIERPPLTFLTSVYYNPQRDFFEQRVRVTNPTYSTLNAVRILVFNLTNTPPITVGNVSGFTAGVPYVQTSAAIPPGSYVDLTIEYLSPLRIMPNPILQAALVPPADPPGPLQGTFQPINRGLLLANRTFLVEFRTLSNRVYAVQYSGDLAIWKTAQPAITGTGNWIQWIDNGEPKTDGSPAAAAARYYRLLQLP